MYLKKIQELTQARKPKAAKPVCRCVAEARPEPQGLAASKNIDFSTWPQIGPGGCHNRPSGVLGPFLNKSHDFAIVFCIIVRFFIKRIAKTRLEPTASHL